MYTCSLCQKPFALESSQKRHIRYCKTRKLTRQRACISCNSAKAKCSFGSPCARCVKKGIQCWYDSHIGAAVPDIDFTLTNLDDLEGFEYSWDNFSAPNEITQAVVCQNPQDSTWCSWLRPGFSTSLIFDERNIIAALRLDTRNQSADIVIRTLRGYPIQMLRRETFPAIIHQQAASSPALTACMGISQMFVMRTSETKGIVWDAIRREHTEFMNKIHQLSKLEMASALSACMIYFIMFLIDTEENDAEALDLILAFQTLTVKWKQLNQVEAELIPITWEDWIIRESQVRLSAFWLLIGCAVCVRTGFELDATASYRSVQLPCSKFAWEAKGSVAWAEANKPGLSHCSLKTVGDLIDVQALEDSEELDKWNANADGLGSLMSLVDRMA